MRPRSQRHVLPVEKIVIASDSFKGCLSSPEVADAVSDGVREVMPDAEIVRVAVADGGEGTYEALAAALDTRRVGCVAADPLMRPRRAAYGITADGTTAVMEMAAASGLTLIAPEERNPLETTTFGFGQMIADALGRGCRRFLLGLGGSATNDGGTGALAALGFRFLDSRGVPLGHGGHILESIASVDSSGADPRLRDSEFDIVCDVTSPFTGPRGAARVFARQKGADEAAVDRLERGMKAFSALVRRTRGIDLDAVPGAGAAGGLGGALMAFIGAVLRPGASAILDEIGFDDIIAGATLIITGEGSLDSQTLMGKTPAGVLARGQRRGIPVIALGGRVSDRRRLLDAGFTAIAAVTPADMPLDIAINPAIARNNIRQATEEIIHRLVKEQKIKPMHNV